MDVNRGSNIVAPQMINMERNISLYQTPLLKLPKLNTIHCNALVIKVNQNNPEQWPGLKLSCSDIIMQSQR